jgi:hypothetical protein
MTNVGAGNEEWLKELMKLDVAQSGPEVSAPVMCQKITMMKG